jgi:hypothetical protein
MVDCSGTSVPPVLHVPQQQQMHRRCLFRRRPRRSRPSSVGSSHPPCPLLSGIHRIGLGSLHASRSLQRWPTTKPTPPPSTTTTAPMPLGHSRYRSEVYEMAHWGMETCRVRRLMAGQEGVAALVCQPGFLNERFPLM